jgi:hypothetical protein
MEQAQVLGLHGPEVPNHYELRLASADLDRFGDYASALAEQVSGYLVEYAHERGLRLVADPRAELLADSSVHVGSVRVLARFANLAPSAQREVEAAIEGTRRLRLAELASALSAADGAAEVALWVTDQRGLRFALEPSVGVVRLGRASDNDVVLESQRVSRYHAQLRWVKLSWLAYDLDSTNGTWVADERVLAAQPRGLRPGVRLRLGDQELEVRSDPDAGGRA